MGEVSKTKADLRAEAVVVQEALRAERTRAKSHRRGVAG